MRHFITMLFASAFLMTLSAGCDTDDGKCTSDYDCAGQRVCELTTGKCATYGCQSCKVDEKCEENKCVPK